MDADKQEREKALADLKAKVSQLMDDAKEEALKRIDSLQASGVDIVGDHMNNADKVWLTPRDFVGAFTDHMKYFSAWMRGTDTPTRKRTIRNYYKMM